MKKPTALFVFTTLTIHFLFAQHEGSLSRNDFAVRDCQVNSMTVKYDIGHFFGEPTVNGVFKWESGFGTDNDCLPATTTIWLKIQYQEAWGFIRLSPVIPKAGAGYGFNVTESPDWDDFICGFDGDEKDGCMSEESAKEVYKNGSITDFRVGY